MVRFAAAVAIAPLAVPSAAQDQPAVPPAPPEVRDFQLKPSGEQTPVLTLPPVEVPRIDVVPKGEPAAPAPTGEAPAADPPPRTTRTTPEPAPPPPRQSAPEPAATPVPVEEPAPEETAPAPALAQPAATAPARTQPAAPSPDAEGEAFPWLLAALGGLALLAAFAFLARRRRSPGTAEQPVYEMETEAPALPEPAPTPPAAAVPPPAPEPRPRIVLEFKPLMAGSTEDQASVQFELVVRNVGDTLARNLRIAIRMINAGPGQNDEIAAFFRAPIEQEIHRPLAIPAGGIAETRRTAVLPKDALQAISFQGKSLFIPVLAFNALYEWGDGRQGQTATSFVVGRETNPPAEKMAPFRLDLGPRVYRTVGQRRHELELVA